MRTAVSGSVPHTEMDDDEKARQCMTAVSVLLVGTVWFASARAHSCDLDMTFHVVIPKPSNRHGRISRLDSLVTKSSERYRPG